MLLLTGAALGDRFGRRQCAALGTSAVCAHLRGVPTAEWFGLAGFRVAGTAYLKALLNALFICTAWQALGTAAAVLTRSVTVAVVAVVAWAVPSSASSAARWQPPRTGFPGSSSCLGADAERCGAAGTAGQGLVSDVGCPWGRPPLAPPPGGLRGSTLPALRARLPCRRVRVAARVQAVHLRHPLNR